MKLYHATAMSNLQDIMENGLRDGVYLTNSWKQALYYVETIEDEDEDASGVVVELELSDLLAAVGDEAILPDRESISEPITSTLGRSEDEVHAAWAVSGGTWRDSLEIVASVRVEAPIPARILACEDYVPEHSSSIG